MKTAKTTSKLLLAALAGALTLGCVSEEADEVSTDLGSSEDEIIGSVLITPFDVAFDACTPSIDFRLQAMRAKLGFLAIEVSPTLPVRLNLFTIDGAGVLSPLDTISPIGIDGALLTSVRSDLALAMSGMSNVFFGASSLLTDAQIDLIMARISLQTRASLLRLIGFTDLSLIGLDVQTALLRAAIRLALSDISANAILFPNLLGLDVANLVLGASLLDTPTSFTRLNLIAGTSLGGLRTLNMAMPFLPGCGIGPGTIGLGSIGLGSIGLGTSGLGPSGRL